MPDVLDANEASPPTMPDPDDDVLDELLEEPPKWPTVVGTISIVWSGLFITCSGCSVGMMPVIRSVMQSSAQGGSLPPTMHLGPMDWLMFGVGMASLVVLLVAGIMLVMRNYQARILHIFYSLLAFPLTGIGTYFQWEKQAQMAQWIQDNPDSPFAQQGAASEIFQMIGFALAAR